MAYSNSDFILDEEEEWEDPAGFDGYWESDFSSGNDNHPDAGEADASQLSGTGISTAGDSLFDDDESSVQSEELAQHDGRTVGDDSPAPLDWQTDEQREAWQRAYDAAFPVIERMSTLELEHAYDRRLPESKIRVDNLRKLNDLTSPKVGVWPRSRLSKQRSRSLFEPRARYRLPERLPQSARALPGRPEWISMPLVGESEDETSIDDFVHDRRRTSSVGSDAEIRRQLLQYLVEEAESASALLAVAMDEAEQQKRASWWGSMVGSKAAISEVQRSARLEELQGQVNEAWDRVDEVYAAREARREERLQAERAKDRMYEMSGGLGETSEDELERYAYERNLKRRRSSDGSSEKSGGALKRPRLTITPASRLPRRKERRRR